MVANQKVTGTAATMPAGLTMGTLISVGVTLAGTFLSGYFISKEIIPQESVGYCSMIILLLASILGSATSAKRIKHRQLLVTVLSGVIYYSILISLTALFFGGSYQGMGATALMVIAGCTVTFLIGRRGERGHSRRSKKYRHR